MTFSEKKKIKKFSKIPEAYHTFKIPVPVFLDILYIFKNGTYFFFNILCFFLLGVTPGNPWIVLHPGEFELTSLKHQYEGLVPGKSLEMPEKLKVGRVRDKIERLLTPVDCYHPGDENGQCTTDPCGLNNRDREVEKLLTSTDCFHSGDKKGQCTTDPCGLNNRDREVEKLLTSTDCNHKTR